MGEGFGGWKEEKLNATVFLTNPHMNGVGPDNIVQMAAVHIPGFFVISTFVATQRQHGQYLDGHSSLLAGFFSDRERKSCGCAVALFIFLDAEEDIIPPLSLFPNPSDGAISSS